MARKKNKAMTAAEEKKFIEEVEKYKKNGQSISWATIDQKLFHRRFGSNYLYQKYNRTLKVKHFEWTKDTRIELLYYCDKYKLDGSISWSNMIESEGYSVSVTQLYNQYKSIMRTNTELQELYENLSNEELMDIVARAKAYRLAADSNTSTSGSTSTTSSSNSNIRKSGSSTRSSKKKQVKQEQLLPVKKRKRPADQQQIQQIQQPIQLNDNKKHHNEDEEYIQPKRSRQVYDDYSDHEDSKRTKDEYRIVTRSATRAAAYKMTSDTLDTSSSTLKDYEELEEEICSTTTDEEESSCSQPLPTIANLSPDEDEDDSHKYHPLECLMEVCCREGRREGLSSSTSTATVISEEYSPDQFQQSDTSFDISSNPLQSEDVRSVKTDITTSNSYQEIPTLPPISHLFEFSKDPHLSNRGQYPWYTGQYRI
jgi:hypothetical protein